MILKVTNKKTEWQKAVIRLDKLWSELIRRRAIFRVQRCERCAMMGTGVFKDWKELQAHHFFTRDNRTTRWDERNGCGLCGGCHNYVQKNDEANKELMIYLIPDAKERELLYVLTNMTTKQCPVDYTAVEIYLKQEIRRLE